MPSGAKKRKAAKKKMSQRPNNNNNNNPSSSIHSHCDDDVKHYNEKESDGGELSSPASQDHQNSQHPFAEGAEDEVDKREDSPSVRLVFPEKNSSEGVNSGESELKSEEKEDIKSKDISIESNKEVRNGGSSGSSSSSDDESHVVEKKIVVVETAPAVDSAKPVESLAEVVGQVNDKIAVGENNNGVVEAGSAVDSGLQENVEKKLRTLDSATEIREDKLVLSLNSPNVQTSNSAEHVQDCGSPECSDSQPLVAPAPQPVQKTSLKSCCGIFELFTSSNR